MSQINVIRPTACDADCQLVRFWFGMKQPVNDGDPPEEKGSVFHPPTPHV